MRIRHVIPIGIGAYLAGIALFAHVDTASAAFRRVHSSQCHWNFDTAGPTVSNGNDLRVMAQSRDIYCPAPSDSELPHAATVTLNVHGFSPANPRARSQACAKSFNAIAFTCGPFKNWAAGIGGVLGVNVAVWSSHPADFPYVHSFMPPGSVLYGFYMQN